ncbi:MAG TPA: S49 family peptidase [Tissierellaceae bacterium]|nr:S49 family peptidase [Tissierellaceae bacterium]
MGIELKLLRSEWAVNLRIGLSYLADIYSLEDRASNLIEESNKVTVHYEGLRSEVYDDVNDISSTSVDGIAVVKLSGAMLLDDGLCHTGIGTFCSRLRALDELKSIKGILVEVDSGGGESQAGQLLYSTMKDLKKKTGAIVHTAASAAYMGILPADFIMAVGELSLTGSIGALYSIDKEILRMLKEDYLTVYSDLSPQKNIETRELLEDVDIGIKSLLNDTVEIFHDMVLNTRALTYKKKDTLEGGVFRSREAKKRGLIDHIGSYNKALTLMNKII